jgi:hypothetical protein
MRMSREIGMVLLIIVTGNTVGIEVIGAALVFNFSS